jgi:hypothetical protein
MDYYVGRDNLKNMNERKAYEIQCAAEKRMAILVHQQGSANTIVKWSSNAYPHRPFAKDEKAMSKQLGRLLDKYSGKDSWGGIGVTNGQYLVPNNFAEFFASELRMVLDSGIEFR